MLLNMCVLVTMQLHRTLAQVFTQQERQQLAKCKSVILVVSECFYFCINNKTFLDSDRLPHNNCNKLYHVLMILVAG